MSTEIPERWKKGKFHRGELHQYLKICSPEEKALVCLCKVTDPKLENDKGAIMAGQLVTYVTLSNMLEKNKRKTVTAPRLARRYRDERNARIRRKLSSILNIFKKNKDSTLWKR